MKCLCYFVLASFTYNLLNCSAVYGSCSRMKGYIISAASFLWWSKEIKKQVDIYFYSLTECFENEKLGPLSQSCRQGMITFCSVSFCRNNACLRHNILGVLRTGGFRPWEFYGSSDLSCWGNFWKWTFRWFTHTVNLFRIFPMFLKQHKRSTGKSGGCWWTGLIPLQISHLPCRSPWEVLVLADAEHVSITTSINAHLLALRNLFRYRCWQS